MDEQLNSIVKQLNRLVKKQTGLSPRAKTIERALKHFVDNYSGGGAGGDSIWGNITGSVENQTDLINKIDEMIDDELANFEHLDYEVVDTEPTPATAEEGVRYLYKPAGATAYNEYILIGGTIYNIGSTEDINLTNYYTKTEVDAELNGKADVSDIPTKTSDLTNDSLFVDKDTDQLTNYTTTVSMNNALNLKADKTTTYTKDETDAKLDLKADADDIPTDTNQLTNGAGFITKSVNNLDNYTTTTALNTALNLKANATDIPTKTSDLTNDTGYIDANVNNLTNYTKTTDLNTALNLKADKATTYNKTEVDTALNLKADKSTTYTKTEVDNKLDLKANQTALDTTNTNIGTLSSLNTDDKSSIVNAINEVLDLGYQYIVGDDTDVANNTPTGIASVNLTKGLWILVANYNFPANATGWRRCNLAGAAGYDGVDASCNPVTSGITRMINMKVFNLDAPKTIYANVRQNSGSTLTCKAWIYAIKVGQYQS